MFNLAISPGFILLFEGSTFPSSDRKAADPLLNLKGIKQSLDQPGSGSSLAVQKQIVPSKATRFTHEYISIKIML